MNTTSSNFLDGVDVDALAAQIDAEAETATSVQKAEAVEYVDALNRLTTAEAEWKQALVDRDVALAAHNEAIKLLRVRLQRARDLADRLKPRRPRGRPPVHKR